MSAPGPLSFARLLQQFFMQRLMQQQRASPCTVAAYRDSFRLLLAFAHRRLGKRPSDIALDDLNASFILEFLNHLEVERHNCVRSRNARFAAIRSFMEYVAFQEPSALALTRSVLAIPMKRFEQPLIGFLSREHVEAILAAPDPNTWTGQRDRVMLATLYNTGARVSELIGMRVVDLILKPSGSVLIRGKGRKHRSVPLWSATTAQLKRWLREYPRQTTSLSPPDSSLNCHAYAASRCRHHGHRTLARAREPRDHASVCRSGSRDERAGAKGASGSLPETAPIPAKGSRPAVLAELVIMHSLLPC